MYRYCGDTTLERASTIGEVTAPRYVARFRHQISQPNLRTPCERGRGRSFSIRSRRFQLTRASFSALLFITQNVGRQHMRMYRDTGVGIHEGSYSPECRQSDTAVPIEFFHSHNKRNTEGYYVHQFLSSRSPVEPPNPDRRKNLFRQDECGESRRSCLGLNLKRLAP